MSRRYVNSVSIFTTANIQKEPKYPPIERWIKKMWYIHGGVLLSLEKRRKT